MPGIYNMLSFIVNSFLHTDYITYFETSKKLFCRIVGDCKHSPIVLYGGRIERVHLQVCDRKGNFVWKIYTEFQAGQNSYFSLSLPLSLSLSFSLSLSLSISLSPSLSHILSIFLSLSLSLSPSLSPPLPLSPSLSHSLPPISPSLYLPPPLSLSLSLSLSIYLSLSPCYVMRQPILIQALAVFDKIRASVCA
ncbi:hypothetical protein EGW08_012633 [Elysia chlorotica]|uniref:Uncharacterized protein n=1 Tax=Elysia chlorotica TaxID=188477 RepID=A0A3S1C0J3_ELYCH|nr:hypothetical protein EGW08_012633 [Elysia chlorotica]